MVCDRHSKDREPPLPVHLGLRIYSQTRQSKLVDEMFRLGLSVSYDRVLEIENTMVRSLCTKFDEEGVVCPPNLAKSLFTTSAWKLFGLKLKIKQKRTQSLVLHITIPVEIYLPS